MKKIKHWSKSRRVIDVLVLLYNGVIVWHTLKPLPDGLDYAGDLQHVENIEMLYDLSFAQDKKGTNLKYELRIFDEPYKINYR